MTATRTEIGAPAVDTRWFPSELWLVFGLSLGLSGVRAFVDLMADLASGRSLTSLTAGLNGSQAPGRPWLDLTLQLVSLTAGVVPVFLVWHFLLRSDERMATLGVDATRRKWDATFGAGLAAVIGGAGLFLYLGAHALGVSLTVVPENLPDVWWRIPVLFLSALQNATLEEVLVAGFLLHRLRQLGWGDNKALALSSVVRGSYHLYQGLGGFVGNAIMGVIFGRIYQRWGRVTPLLIAHTLMDSVAFIGYAVLANHVSWLPTPQNP